MLSLFPVHRPSVSVGVNPRALRFVAIRRMPFRTPTISQASERLLQEGWMTPSPSTQNIVRMDAVEQELRALTARISDRTVALSLPDECATFGVFSFDTLAANQEEREGVIRWRFQQETDIKVGREKLVYRLFPGEKTVSVLAAIVNESVLQQYLALFDAARLLPVSIGFETFQVFDAFRGIMEAGPERFFAHYNGQTLAFLAFQYGRPVFLRKRRIKFPGTHVQDELIATVQYFDDRFFRVGTEQPVSKLYFVDTSRAAASTNPSFETSTMVTIPAVHRARSVEVVPLNWTALRAKPCKAELSNAFLPMAAGIGIT